MRTFLADCLLVRQKEHWESRPWPCAVQEELRRVGLDSCVAVADEPTALDASGYTGRLSHILGRDTCLVGSASIAVGVHMFWMATPAETAGHPQLLESDSACRQAGARSS